MCLPKSKSTPAPVAPPPPPMLEQEAPKKRMLSSTLAVKARGSKDYRRSRPGVSVGGNTTTGLGIGS